MTSFPPPKEQNFPKKASPLTKQRPQGRRSQVLEHLAKEAEQLEEFPLHVLSDIDQTVFIGTFGAGRRALGKRCAFVLFVVLASLKDSQRAGKAMQSCFCDHGKLFRNTTRFQRSKDFWFMAYWNALSLEFSLKRFLQKSPPLHSKLPGSSSSLVAAVSSN